MNVIKQQLIDLDYCSESEFNGRYYRSVLRRPELLAEIQRTYPTVSIREALYLVGKELSSPPVCQNCRSPVSFISFSKGYAKYCSAKCNNSGLGAENKRRSMLQKYGASHYSSTKEYKEKYEKTCLAKYGVRNPNQSDIIKQKKMQTYKKTLGVSNPSLCLSSVDKRKKARWIDTYTRLGPRLCHLVDPLFSTSDYVGIQHKYPWKCVRCSTVFFDHLQYGKIPTCPTCFQSSMPFSKIEKEVVSWLRSLSIEVLENDKTIIAPKELDIVIPEHKVAIEVNGVYRHSEIAGNKSPRYHIDKLNSCLSQGYQLLQIWDIEWRNHQEIVQSIILSKLGKVGTTLYARSCESRSVSSSDAKVFFTENHIQGFYPSSYYEGLYYKNTLVQCVSLKKARYSNECDWELTRAASLLTYRVVGGLSKLLAHLPVSGSIVSYADRRLFTGRGYEAVGFTQLRETPPNYLYTSKPNSYSYFVSRETFQKHKLKTLLPTYDPVLTEWENMQLAGYDRIWDCGTIVYKLDL